MKLFLLLLLLSFVFCMGYSVESNDSNSIDGVWDISNNLTKVGKIRIYSGEYRVYLKDDKKSIEPAYFLKNRKGTVSFFLKKSKLRDGILVGIISFDDHQISYEVRKDYDDKILYFHSRVSEPLKSWGISK